MLTLITWQATLASVVAITAALHALLVTLRPELFRRTFATTNVAIVASFVVVDILFTAFMVTSMMYWLKV
jgi:hypothetical protein